MKVRNRSLAVSEYNGSWTDASDEMCPCRPCYRPHDCGYSINGCWIVNMECVFRHSKGCPSPKPTPQHVFTKYGRFWVVLSLNESSRNKMKRVYKPDNVIVYAIIDNLHYRVWEIDWARRVAKIGWKGAECWESFDVLKLEIEASEESKLGYEEASEESKLGYEEAIETFFGKKRG